MKKTLIVVSFLFFVWLAVKAPSFAGSEITKFQDPDRAVQCDDFSASAIPTGHGCTVTAHTLFIFQGGQIVTATIAYDEEPSISDLLAEAVEAAQDFSDTEIFEDTEGMGLTLKTQPIGLTSVWDLTSGAQNTELLQAQITVR